MDYARSRPRPIARAPHRTVQHSSVVQASPGLRPISPPRMKPIVTSMEMLSLPPKRQPVLPIKPAHAAVPAVHAVATKSVTSAEPKALATNQPTLSIKITVPDSKMLERVVSWRPTTRQVIMAIVAFCIFTVGYQAGRHTASTPKIQPAFSTQLLSPTGKYT